MTKRGAQQPDDETGHSPRGPRRSQMTQRRAHGPAERVYSQPRLPVVSVSPALVLSSPVVLFSSSWSTRSVRAFSGAAIRVTHDGAQVSLRGRMEVRSRRPSSCPVPTFLSFAARIAREAMVKSLANMVTRRGTRRDAMRRCVGVL